MATAIQNAHSTRLQTQAAAFNNLAKHYAVWQQTAPQRTAEDSLGMIPGEAHWKNGTCEKGVQGLKELMYKLASDFPDEAFVDLLSEATRVFNSRELVRGFSPIQHVMGRAPDETGRFLSSSSGLE